MTPRSSSPTISSFNQEPSPPLQRELSKIIPIIGSKLGLFRLVVFDFDNTISQISTCRPQQLSVAEVQQIPLQNIIDDPTLFRQFVSYIQSLDISVAIASFGDKEVILTILNRVYSQENNPFGLNNIITPQDISAKYNINWSSCYEPPQGYSKNNMLELLAERFKISQNERSKILLIDDSIKNYQEARGGQYSPILITASAGILPMITTVLRMITYGFVTGSELDTFVFALQRGQHIQVPNVTVGYQSIPLISFQEFTQRLPEIVQHDYYLITQRWLSSDPPNRVLTVIDRLNNVYLVLVKVDPATKQVFPTQ